MQELRRVWTRLKMTLFAHANRDKAVNQSTAFNTRVMVQGVSSQVVGDRGSRDGARRPQRGRRVMVQVAQGGIGNEDKAIECVETCWCK